MGWNGQGIIYISALSHHILFPSLFSPYQVISRNLPWASSRGATFGVDSY